MTTGFQVAYDPYTGEPLNPEEQEAHARLQAAQAYGFRPPPPQTGDESLDARLGGFARSWPRPPQRRGDVAAGLEIMNQSPSEFGARLATQVLIDPFAGDLGPAGALLSPATYLGGAALASRGMSVGAAQAIREGVGGFAGAAAANRALPKDTNPLVRLGTELAAGAGIGFAAGRPAAQAAKAASAFLGEAPPGYRSPSERGALRAEIFPGSERLARRLRRGASKSSFTDDELMAQQAHIEREVGSNPNLSSAIAKIQDNIAIEEQLRSRTGPVAEELKQARGQQATGAKDARTWAAENRVTLREAARAAAEGTTTGGNRRTFAPGANLTDDESRAISHLLATSPSIEARPLSYRNYVSALETFLDGGTIYPEQRARLSDLLGISLERKTAGPATGARAPGLEAQFPARFNEPPQDAPVLQTARNTPNQEVAGLTQVLGGDGQMKRGVIQPGLLDPETYMIVNPDTGMPVPDFRADGTVIPGSEIRRTVQAGRANLPPEQGPQPAMQRPPTTQNLVEPLALGESGFVQPGTGLTANETIPSRSMLPARRGPNGEIIPAGLEAPAPPMAARITPEQYAELQRLAHARPLTADEIAAMRAFDDAAASTTRSFDVAGEGGLRPVTETRSIQPSLLEPGEYTLIDASTGEPIARVDHLGNPIKGTVDIRKSSEPVPGVPDAGTNRGRQIGLPGVERTNRERGSVWQNVKDALSGVRTVWSADAASFAGRQGRKAMLSHNRAWRRAVKDNLDAFADEKKAWAASDRVDASPNRAKYDEMGIDLPDPNNYDMSVQEEAFLHGSSTVARATQRIPLVRRAERGSAAFMKTLRSGIADDIIERFTPEQWAKMDTRDKEALGRITNAITGRGEIPQFAKDHIQSLNTLFYSTRNQVANAQVPASMFLGRTSLVRKEAAKAYVTDFAFKWSIRALWMAAGGKVGLDINNSDWGKLVFDDGSRLDMDGGDLQLQRLIANEISGGNTTPGGRFRQEDRIKIAGDYIRSKFAPVPSELDALATGRVELTPEGLSKEALKSASYMWLQDVAEAVSAARKQGLAGIEQGTRAFIAGQVGIGSSVSQSDVLRNTLARGRYDALPPKEQIESVGAKTWGDMQVATNTPERYRAEIQQFPTHADWRAAVIEAYADRRRASGVPEELVGEFAERDFASHPVQQKFSEVRNVYERRWMRANPALALQVVGEDADLPQRERRISLARDEIAFLLRHALSAKK